MYVESIIVTITKLFEFFKFLGVMLCSVVDRWQGTSYLHLQGQNLNMEASGFCTRRSSNP